jgi:hypothetical protein
MFGVNNVESGSSTATGSAAAALALPITQVR